MQASIWMHTTVSGPSKYCRVLLTVHWHCPWAVSMMEKSVCWVGAALYYPPGISVCVCKCVYVYVWMHSKVAMCVMAILLFMGRDLEPVTRLRLLLRERDKQHWTCTHRYTLKKHTACLSSLQCSHMTSWSFRMCCSSYSQFKWKFAPGLFVGLNFYTAVLLDERAGGGYKSIFLTLKWTCVKIEKSVFLCKFVQAAAVKYFRY